MPPIPESPSNILQTLSAGNLEPYVQSPRAGSPLEKSPTLIKFEARKASYVKEGAWNTESKRIWDKNPQFAVNTKGEHITIDKAGGISRIHTLTLIQIASDLGKDNLSAQEIAQAVKLADKITALAQKGLGFTNGRTDVDLTLFVGDCLREVEWEKRVKPAIIGKEPAPSVKYAEIPNPFKNLPLPKQRENAKWLFFDAMAAIRTQVKDFQGGYDKALIDPKVTPAQRVRAQTYGHEARSSWH